MKVELKVFSDAAHNNLILTGFMMLKKQRKIKLKITKDYQMAKKVSNGTIVEAIIDGKTKIAFGTMDGYNFDFKLMDEYLSTLDYFFLRSFSAEKNKQFSPENQKKIYPLSLNYSVSYLLNPLDYGHGIIKDLITFLWKIKIHSGVGLYENKNKQTNGKVLFMTRLWDTDESALHNNERNERKNINEFRISLIRKLKEELGNEIFEGGIYDCDLARKMCPDLILDSEKTEKINYIQTMKSVSICIATTGLHKSIGWKFAEYVAAGKAIVSEPLNYEVFGDFKKDDNYLEFTTAEECLTQVKKLLSDEGLRTKIENANREYYLNYSRPDKQVENALHIAIN